MKKMVASARGLAAVALGFGLAGATQAAELGFVYARGAPGPGYAEVATLLGSGDTLRDAGVEGGAEAARSVILNLLLGGKPPAAIRMATNRDAADLVAAGTMTDLSALAQAENWPAAPACAFAGKVYCVPVSAGDGCVEAVFFPQQPDPALTAAQFRLAAAITGKGLLSAPAPDCAVAGGGG